MHSQARASDSHRHIHPSWNAFLFREDEYAGSHPTPADALIVIEVSDTTLGDDLRVKLPVYAWAGIPEAWIADLTRRGDAVSRYSDPDPGSGTHQTIVRFGPGEEIRSAVLPGLALPVDAILGPR